VNGAPAGYAEIRILNAAFGGWDQADSRGFFEIGRALEGRQTLEVRLGGSSAWQLAGSVDVRKDVTVRVEVVYQDATNGWSVRSR
jgi:hypothetical protein